MVWWKHSTEADVNTLSDQFAAQFVGPFNLDTQQLQTLGGATVPTLKMGDEILSDADKLDSFSKKNKCIASVFVKIGDEYIRIATTARKRDGTVALGTLLDHSNPAYQKIQKGVSSADSVNLFGVEYYTKYDPIFDSEKNVIGILFVGLRRKSYREARVFQICLVFSAAIGVQLLTLHEHAGWIGFTLMLIYAGFDKGTSLQRTRERVFGVILGLFIGYFIWVFGQIDYRFIIAMIPILLFFTYYFVGRNFIYQSAFIVALSVLGSDYYKSDNNAVANFLFEYLIFTLVAFAICIIFDHVVFRKVNLSRKFYFDLQEKILDHLNELFKIVAHQPLRRAHYIKNSNQFNVSVLELYAFIEATKYDIQNKTLEDESHVFRENMQQAYHNIRRLFLRTSLRNDQLVSETRKILDELEKSVYTL